MLLSRFGRSQPAKRRVRTESRGVREGWLSERAVYLQCLTHTNTHIHTIPAERARSMLNPTPKHCTVWPFRQPLSTATARFVLWLRRLHGDSSSCLEIKLNLTVTRFVKTKTFLHWFIQWVNNNCNSLSSYLLLMYCKYILLNSTVLSANNSAALHSHGQARAAVDDYLPS